jgi:hypothetical protein
VIDNHISSALTVDHLHKILTLNIYKNAAKALYHFMLTLRGCTKSFDAHHPAQVQHGSTYTATRPMRQNALPGT